MSSKPGERDDQDLEIVITEEISAPSDIGDASDVLDEDAGNASEAKIAEDLAVETEPETTDPPECDEKSEIKETNPSRLSGQFFSALLGGVCAAALAFGLSFVTPDGWPLMRADSEETLSRITELEAALEATTAQLENLEIPDAAAIVDRTASALREEILQGDAHSATQLQALSERVGVFEARLDAMERRPIEGAEASQAAIDAFSRDVAALKAELEAQRTSVDAALDKVLEDSITAESNAAAAARSQAISALRSALDRGASRAEPVADLVALGVNVPDVLADVSQDIPSASLVRTAFPAAARLALDAARRAAVEDGSASGIGGFLRAQLGARSLRPQEGETADAVLSRVESALAGGDLKGAMVEFATLPEAAQPAMEAWAEMAGLRLAALAALEGLHAQNLTNITPSQ